MKNTEYSEIKFKLRRGEYWRLSKDLFGDTGADIHDFEVENYIYFLDNVKSWRDLVAGLAELSPLADDALEVAKQMS